MLDQLKVYRGVLYVVLITTVMIYIVQPVNAQQNIRSRTSIQNEYLDGERDDKFSDYMEKAMYMGNNNYNNGITHWVVQAYTSSLSVNEIDNIFIQNRSESSDKIVYKVNTIINYHIEICGDDGRTLESVDYSKLLLEDGKGDLMLFHGKGYKKSITDEVVDGVFRESRANIQYPIRIPTKALSLKVYPNEYGYLLPKNNVDTLLLTHTLELERNKRNEGITAEIEFDGQSVDQANFDTDFGYYTIRLYKSNTCKKNFDIVTIQQKDGAEFKVEMIVQMTGSFNEDEKEIAYMPIYLTKPGMEQKAIFNNDLWSFLFQEVYPLGGFDNAFKVYQGKATCNYDQNGKYVVFD